MAKQIKRTYSRPVLNKLMNISSEVSLGLMEHYANKTMSSIYFLDLVLFYIASEEVAMQENEKIADLLDVRINSMKKDIEKYELMAEQAGINVNDGSSFEWSINKSIEYKVYSPLCAKYLMLITMVDRLVTILAQLWIHGELKPNQYKRKTVAIRTSVVQFSRSILNSAKRAHQVAKESNKKEEIELSMKELEIESPEQVEFEDSEEAPQENQTEEKTKEVA